MDYFSLFGLSAHYQIDAQLLASRFLDLQRQYHPDKFACCSQEQQLAAVHKSAIINEAWQTLRNPLSRAEHLLSLHGFYLTSEQCTIDDKAFLMEQISLREELDEIEQRQDKVRIQVFAHRIKALFNLLYQNMTTELDNQAWQKAADTVSKLRFLDELCTATERIKEKLLDL